MPTTELKIGIFCPTRKRVNSLVRLMNSIAMSAKNPKRVSFHLYVDSDDTETLQFIEQAKAESPLEIFAVVEPPNTRPLSDTYNILFEDSKIDVMMQFGDDTIMRTQDWDVLIDEAFQKYDDRLILAYGHDGIHNEGFAPHYALHRNWIETLGYASPPYFTADWSDAWMFEIAKTIKRNIFIPELMIEHMHWTQGKSPVDETTMLGEARRHNDGNEQLFRSEPMVQQRQQAIKLLQSKIDESGDSA
jgi:hypothetical protein